MYNPRVSTSTASRPGTPVSSIGRRIAKLRVNVLGAGGDRLRGQAYQAGFAVLLRLTHGLACILLQALPLTALSARAAASGDYHRIGLYADRTAAVNVAIDRYDPEYPSSVNGDSVWALRASGDTMCVFRSFADSGIVLRATDTAPSYVEYSVNPHRTIANLGVMACGRQVHADDAGREAMRITVFYENGDSSAAVLAVGRQLRDTYYGWDFCNGTQLFFYNTAPADPLSAQLWADPGSRWANFLDAQEVILPFAKRSLMATRVRISSVPLGRPCAGGTLWSSVYLAGLTVWTEPPHVLLVHGICGDASNWDPFAQVLADSGFVVDRLQYGSTVSSLRPAHYVNALASKLATMRPDPVAVVAHSMGGLITRDYIRRELASGRSNKVVQLVTLGSPHHGSDLLAKVLGWGPVVDRLLGPVFGPCLSSTFSKPALMDMVPGSSYLNRLNYGTQDSLKDPADGHGWSSHQPETTLPADVYIASIAGTGSFCNPDLRGFLWPKDPAYHPNDCTVATGGALLSSASAFHAADTLLALEKPAAHTDKATEPCGEAYYSFSTLAMRVSSILRDSPAAPPLSAPGQEAALAPARASATVEDSLQMVPVIVDSVAAGQVLDRTVAIPITSLARFTLLSTNAHLALLDPSGGLITLADTSSSAGITYYATADPGLEGFEVAAPQPGTWTMRVDASTAGEGQRIGGIVEYASGSAVRLSVLTNPIYPGDVFRVRGQLASGGVPRTDAAWGCNVLQPDGLEVPLALYDDGAHSDSLAGDGIYGNEVTPAGGVGQYALSASATASGVGPLAAVAYGELADEQDLSLHWNDIQVSRNLPYAGDSLTVYATVHNFSSATALGIVVEFYDLRTGESLATRTIDFAAESSVTVQVPWVPAPPDSHEIQVRISPYVLDESDYTNNTASRVFVLGSLVDAEPGGAPRRLRFDPPYPNPASRGVAFSFAVPRSSAGELNVYDILGRRVRAWRWASLAPGIHSVVWDGQGASGEHLGPGVYFCRLRVGDERAQRKIVLRN